MANLPEFNAPHQLPPSTRLLHVTRLRKALEQLMTERERDYYECLFEHLTDFQNDLLIDLERSVPPLDPSKLPD